MLRKRCSRTNLLAFTGNLRVERIGMEACAGAHSSAEPCAHKVTTYD